ncbi:MAG TPA: hypothetical protein VNF29_05655 [Candidatus Binataceae bacterium]|nr:hypothetical protein [Candidatus Binataceae bacterium]
MLVALILATGWPAAVPRSIADVPEYRQYAIAGPALVHSPYSGRVLHPLLVHLVSAATGLSIDSSFLAVALATLAAFAILIAAIFAEIGAPPQAMVALMFCPLMAGAFDNIYFQDLTQWVLIAGFFWLMMRAQLWPAMAMLVLAYLTRESALLLGAAVMGAGIMARDFRLIIGAGAAIIIAAAIAAVFAAHGLPNQHHVNLLVFLALKMPFEFALNVLGLFIVPNTLAGFPSNQCVPIFIVHLPAALRFGGLSWVSYCGWRPEYTLFTLCELVTLFGVCPGAMLAVMLRWPAMSRILEHRWLAIALIYGALAYALGTSEGAELDREIGSAWPIFWIALPALIGAGRSLARPVMIRLAVYNLFVAWIAPWIETATGYSNSGIFATIVIAIVFQYLAFREVSRLEQVGGVLPSGGLKPRLAARN